MKFKLVSELLNELQSFVRGGSPLSTLGIGLSNMIKKWFEENDVDEEKYKINDDSSVTVNISKFSEKSHQGYNKDININSEFWSALFNNDHNVNENLFDRDTIRFIMEKDYKKIDNFINMFPNKKENIIKIARNTYSNNLEHYLKSNYSKDIEETHPYYLYRDSTSASHKDLEKVLSKMTANQQLEISFRNNYKEGMMKALENGANPETQVNTRNRYDRTNFFQLSIKKNDIDIIEKILENKETIDRFKDERQFIGYLMYAIKHNFIEIVKLMAPYFKNVELGSLQKKTYNSFALRHNLLLNKEEIYVNPRTEFYKRLRRK